MFKKLSGYDYTNIWGYITLSDRLNKYLTQIGEARSAIAYFSKEYDKAK
jgi:hypothetical protein